MDWLNWFVAPVVFSVVYSAVSRWFRQYWLRRKLLRKEQQAELTRICEEALHRYHYTMETCNRLAIWCLKHRTRSGDG